MTIEELIQQYHDRSMALARSAVEAFEKGQGSAAYKLLGRSGELLGVVADLKAVAAQGKSAASEPASKS